MREFAYDLQDRKAETAVNSPRRTEQAPHPIGLPLMQTTGMQLSASLAFNEEVEWHWQHVPNGSYVTGYTIRPRIPVIREPV